MSPSRQDLKRQRTHLAIQDAALELFLERGYRETTIRAIADRADVAARTVTVHFPSKDALLFELEPFDITALDAALNKPDRSDSALATFRTWLVNAMLELDRGDPDGRFWERRARRAQVVESEPELRGRRRAGHFELEALLADAIGRDTGRSGTSLAPRLAALTAVEGVRELYESDEARALASPPTVDDLLELIDFIITAATTGLHANTG